MNLRQQFLQNLAPTSFEPLALHITHAKGAQLFDEKGKSYIDLIGGISVSNVGHSHPEIIQAIQSQIEKYMHIMVYGELIQTPQIEYATALTDLLDKSLNSVYFTNSGAEAVEGAMKLAKRSTGKTQIAAFNKSYHGSTQGALSIIGDEYFKNAYRPLLPDILNLEYNNYSCLNQITEKTAAVFCEPIQAEAGVIIPEISWINALRDRCSEMGAFLIFDEIQTGFGRTGHLFAYQDLGFVPDILLLGKALGGGMPLGAFITNYNIMKNLAQAPILGHITTFGGHPVSCTAGLASLRLLLKNNWIKDAPRKGELIKKHLASSNEIKQIRQKGLMLSLKYSSFDKVKAIISKTLLAKNAVFTDWFLFAPDCIRIVPPLCINDEELITACDTLLSCE